MTRGMSVEVFELSDVAFCLAPPVGVPLTNRIWVAAVGTQGRIVSFTVEMCMGMRFPRGMGIKHGIGNRNGSELER